jgi:hypothetical protein
MNKKILWLRISYWMGVLARLSGFSLLEKIFDGGSSVFSRIGVPGGGLNRL